MEKVKRKETRVKFTSLEEIVRLQFILYCFSKGIHLTPGDYSLLTHIAINGYDRKTTPGELVEAKKFKHTQSVRNTRNKLLKENFLIEPRRWEYFINPELQIESSGHVMIDFKAINL